MLVGMKKFKRALFIFRRDLRLFDNTALRAACEQAEQVFACFIFDPRQVEEHPYRSLNALQFLVESLDDLARELEAAGGVLYIFKGVADQVAGDLMTELACDALFFNKDYTPFSQQRDQALLKVCADMGVAASAYDDALLNPPDKAVKDDGTAYSIFTPFYKKMLAREVAKPIALKQAVWYTKPIKQSVKKIEAVLDGFNNKHLAVRPGRAQGLKLLQRACAEQSQYLETRDMLTEQTTHLSAHLKFGTLSVREVYAAFYKKFGLNAPLIRQLFWRDFFTTIAFHSPHVFGNSFNAAYDRVVWSQDRKRFQAWCDGQTGFPLVDAGMRELNATGFMHNRARMVVASFLTKDLHIDWRWGERYFASKLVDYDPAVNNGSWQWAASTGCDAQPYFRVFNPWLQQKKFDPQAEYIKRWVEALKVVPAQAIHALGSPKLPRPAGYPAPIVDHGVESKVAIQRFKTVLK